MSESDSDEKLDFLHEMAPDAYEVRSTVVLSDNPATRWEQLCDLYAPMDDDGVRHPEDGFISREDYLRLADIVVIKL